MSQFPMLTKSRNCRRKKSHDTFRGPNIFTRQKKKKTRIHRKVGKMKKI